MAKKEYTYRGKSIDELKQLSVSEYTKMTTSRIRRTIKRGFTEQQKIFIRNFEKKDGIKTKERDMVILPFMIGKTVKIHTGKDFVPVTIQPEMLGHVLGEFAMTRKKVNHTSPGIGAKEATKGK